MSTELNPEPQEPKPTRHEAEFARLGVLIAEYCAQIQALRMLARRSVAEELIDWRRRENR